MLLAANGNLKNILMANSPMQLKLNFVVCQGLCIKVDGLTWSEI